METPADDHASIDIEGLNIEYQGKDRRKILEAWRKEHRLRELLREFKSLPPPSSERCIYRVPENMQKSYKEAYTPRVIAIGPYHSGNQSLKRMENHKLLYLDNFLKHSRKPLHEYIEMIESLITDIKSCYDEQIDLSNDYFADMMVLDGIFIIQLFLIHGKHRQRPDGDQILDRPWMLNNVRRDMMLLENQMPFFVIKKLFEMAQEPNVPGLLLNLVYRFFSPVMMTEVEEREAKEWEPKVKHFLDAIRFSYLSSVRMKPCIPEAMDGDGPGVKPRKSKSKCLFDIKHFLSSVRTEPCKCEKRKEIEIKFIPNATDLVGAGVNLRKSESKSLFHIEFQNGVLKIPPLNLYRITESYFRNIIAFEQCYHEDDSCLIDYLVFIDQLVNVPADAKLLIDGGIIENWLSSEHAAADLINSYCEDIGLWPRDTYFDSLRQNLIEHYQMPYNEWKETFKRDYCSSPWKVLSAVAAVVLLALTAVQTVCSVLSME